MKIFTLVMFVSALQVSAHTNAQTITLSGKDIPLKKVFTTIEQQTGFVVFYNKDFLSITKPVSLSVYQMPLRDFLDITLRDQPLTYTIEDKTIMLTRKGLSPPNPAKVTEQPAPAYPITGTITNEKGEPLAGASIKVKGSSKGTSTDNQGRFALNANEGEVLVISYTGFKTKELKIGGSRSLAITLLLSDSQLDEVQIIAYGETSRRLSTGNISTVTAKDIEKQPVNNPILALQGRVPGLNIVQSNGIPGGGVTVRVQGRNNLDNNLVGSDPLIVVDGIPYPSQNLKTFLGGGFSSPFGILGSSSEDGIGSSVNYGSPLAYINPSDIESISVLKDADATAIYGSRAANGALLITTKSGRAGQMKVDVNLQQGWGTVGKKLDLLTSEQFMEMRWEGKRNENLGVSTRDYDLRGLWDTTRYTDWQKILIGGTAQYTRMTVGISGGTAHMQYLISSTYGRETTVFPGDFANTTGSLHFNISASSPNKRFKIQLGGSYMVNNNELPAEDFTDYALNLPPVAPALYNDDGTLNWAPDPLQNSNSSWFNPLSKQQYIFDTKTHNLISHGSITYNILPGLNLKSTFGFNSITTDQFVAALDGSIKPESRQSRTRQSDFSYNTSRSWIAEPQLTFDRKVGDHSLGLLTGTTFQYQNNNGRSFMALGHSSDLLLRDMLAGTSLTARGTDVNEYKYNAIFGRFNYSYRDKYLVSLNARRDGSSRFGPNSRFHNFGSVGLGWILSEERFFKNSLPFVSFAKIRGSYGTTGNDQIGNYRYMSLYFSTNQQIPYQGQGVSGPLELPNDNLEWEETRKLQAGIELGLWNDRLLVTTNYSYNRTSNSLTAVKMPFLTGFTNFLQNLPALIQNTGWEFSINSTNISSGDFRWNTNINLTIPRNKLVAFPGLETSTLSQSMAIGQPLSIGKVAPYYGIDPATGSYTVRDQHGNPTSYAAMEDRTIFTYTGPRWYGGVQNSISYKEFSLDILLQFTKQYGFDVLTLTFPGYISTGSSSQTYGNQLAAVMQRWQKPGDNTIYQRFSSNASNASAETGDLTYSDISFARVKNISLSYNFSDRLTQKFKMQHLKLYANGQNLFTITRYRGLDPETQSLSALPPLRIITVGLQATF